MVIWNRALAIYARVTTSNKIRSSCSFYSTASAPSVSEIGVNLPRRRLIRLVRKECAVGVSRLSWGWKGHLRHRLIELLGHPHIETGDHIHDELSTKGPLSSQLVV